MALVLPALPLVWVVELDSCQGPARGATTDITGLDALGRVDLEGWLVLLGALAVLTLTPFLARWVRRPGAAVLVHLVGLAASLLALFAMHFAMTFTLFTTRVLRPGGWWVLSLFVAAAVDAVARLVLSVRAWLRARRLTSS